MCTLATESGIAGPELEGLCNVNPPTLGRLLTPCAPAYSPHVSSLALTPFSLCAGHRYPPPTPPTIRPVVQLVCQSFLYFVFLFSRSRYSHPVCL